jgi:uncharacterized protein YyaL (SSP411 family)
MKISTAARIAADKWVRPSLRETYWGASRLASELSRLTRPGNGTFRRLVWRDGWRFALGTVRPIADETRERMQHAVRWILHAQGATVDRGVPVGYFPCSQETEAWMPSYPETTGYIITSLLAYAERYSDAKVRQAALDMAQWEIQVQMTSGAVQGGPVCPPERQTAAAFNTGMVLDGWCSAFNATQDPAYLAAAQRAADFLTNDIDDSGYFQTNGAFVSQGETKTYTCLCAWAMYRCGVAANEARYRDAAIKVIEGALRQQRTNGWFAHNCLTRSDAPLTHTIGYTLQGVFEVGVAAQRDDFIAAVRTCIDPLIGRIDRHGYLPGRFYADWEPAVFSSCLTGSAQIAIVFYRLYQHSGEARYRAAADALVNYLKGLQVLDSDNPALNGAIPGSFPLFGGYMRGGYPNWATKYFLDVLMLQAQCAAG